MIDGKRFAAGHGLFHNGDLHLFRLGDRTSRRAVAIALKLRNLLLSRRDEISHPHPDRAVDMSLRVVTATLEQRNAFESSNVPEVSLADEALADELSRMVLGYLGIKPR